ncbi:MAG: acetoacetate--CoA ligase, partial [Salinisphaera sp.]|nr:acetoacetate--CoA ligase [Salinisphaera sp.]
MTNPGDLLWTPSAERKAATHLADFMAWLAERGQGFEDYDALWQWSVTHIEDFWAALWAYFHLERYATASYHQILDSHEMPGARWFAGARL